MAGVVLMVLSATKGSLTATVSPESTFGDRPDEGTIYSRPVSVIVSGGSGPYTYSWSRVDTPAPGTPTILPTQPTSATTRFYGYVSGMIDSVWKCTVTDSVGASVSTPDVFVQLSAGA